MTLSSPIVWLETSNLSLEEAEEQEDYIHLYSIDEENNQILFYSRQQTTQEIILTNEYLLEHTGTDYKDIEKILYTHNNPQQYIESIEHPLNRYRANYDFKRNYTKAKTENTLTQEELVGAKVLLTLNPQYHKSPVITQTSQYLETDKKQIKPVSQVAQYLNLTSQYQNLVRDKQQLYSGLIVKEGNIPESYYEQQSRISEQQGRGKIVITQEYKKETLNMLIQDQEKSLDSWLEYLDQEYPTWYQYYVLEGLKKMGSYDKQRNKFSKRRKDYVGIFPELNREALAKVYDYLNKYHNQELNEKDLPKELLDLLKTGSFPRLYEYFLVNMEGITAWDKEETSGEWVKYEQTNNKNIGEQLAKSLEGYNTGWCTAGDSTAQSQLSEGDFYVYYSKNKLGFNSAPRIAIRMEDEQVAEIRGIEPNQNLESLMTPIMKEKIKKLPGGQEYFVKTEHMEKLTSIQEKHDNKETLKDEEIIFLYELEEKIQGFGYEEDPRISHIKEEYKSQKHIKMLKNYLKNTKGIKLKDEEIIIGDITPVKKDELTNIKYIAGKITIKNIDIKLAQGLKVKEIDAYSSSLTELPENLEVEILNIEGSPIERLPNTLKVNILNMPYTHIQELPKNLQVKEIYAFESNLQELPKNLQVEILDVSNTWINELPEGLKVREELDISQTHIKTLPDNFQVKELNIQDTRITQLPSNLKAKAVFANGSLVKELGEGIEIETLNINSTPITSLSKDIKAKKIYAENSQIDKLPVNLELEELNINGTPITQLPQGLKVKKLYASYSQLTSLPQGLEAEQVDISDTPIKQLPTGLKIKDLDLYGCEIESIPSDFTGEINWV